jgi:sialidase-1
MKFALLLVFLLARTVGAADGIIDAVIAPATAENPRNSEGDITVLKDGALLVAWSDFYGGRDDASSARISAAKSRDGGKTWSPRFTLLENSGKQNVMSVSFLRSRSGDLLFFYLVKNSNSDLKAFCRRSTDDAMSWSNPVVVTADAGYFVMNNARVIQLRDGRMLCPTSFVLDYGVRSEPFRNVIYYSDDDGRTWKRGSGVVDAPKRGAMEPGLIQLNDGSVLQIVRTQTGDIWESRSTDRGDSWTKAVKWTVSAPEAPSTLVRLPDNGDFLLVYNPIARVGAPMGGPRTPLAAAISHDEGKSWPLAKLVESDLSTTFAYTSITCNQGRALLTYYAARDGKLSLKFKSIPLSWFRE